MRSALIIALLATGTLDSKPSYRVTPQACEDHKDTHVLVREDVLKVLSDDSKKLELCEQHLSKAQDGMSKLDDHIKSVDNAVDVYKLRDKMMSDHVTRLETMIQRQADYIQQLEANQAEGGPSFETAWESVDGMVGLGAGYIVGTAQCIGIAWVFNQPDFQR